MSYYVRAATVVARPHQVFVLPYDNEFHQVTAVQTFDLADVTVISDCPGDELVAPATLICK